MPSLRVKLVVAVVAVVLLALVATRVPVGPALQEFCDAIGGFGLAGVALFALLLAAGSLVLLPASPFIIAAAAVFGFWLGFLAGMAGLALGSTAGFLLARGFLRREISAHLRKHPTFAGIDLAIEREGWKIIILLRLCPIPFGLANYLYGLTGIRYRPYLFTTLAGGLPSTLLFCHLGAAGKAGLQALSSGQLGHDGGQMALLAVSLVATVAVIVFLPRFARRAVAKHAKVTIPS